MCDLGHVIVADIAVLGVALFFAAMGLYALWFPERVVGFFGTPALGVDGRNEVRAVYGGFGLAVAGLLFVARSGPSWARGVFLAFAVALFGMAAGRLLSWALERRAGFFPWFFFGAELLMGVALLYAFAASSG